jgi:hypothetical protein
MSDHEPVLEVQSADDEMQAARALAAALEVRTREDVDLEVLAVVHLFEAVGEWPVAEEVTHRRLRNDLSTRLRRHRPARWLGLAAAAALAGVAALGVFLSRPSLPAHADLLAARERAARDAVEEISASSASMTVASTRVARVLESEWHARFDATLRNERFAALAGSVSGLASTATGKIFSHSTQKAPIPGGVS